MTERRSASAAYRIAFVYAAVFAVAVLALGAASFLVADARFRRQQDVDLSVETASLLRDYDSEGLPELRRDIARRELGRAANPFGYALADPSGGRRRGRSSSARSRRGGTT